MTRGESTKEEVKWRNIKGGGPINNSSRLRKKKKRNREVHYSSVKGEGGGRKGHNLRKKNRQGGHIGCKVQPRKPK